MVSEVLVGLVILEKARNDEGAKIRDAMAVWFWFFLGV